MAGPNQQIAYDTGLVTVTDYSEGIAGLIAQPLGKAGRSDKREVFAVIIQNRLNNLDNSANPVELMIGTNGNTIWQLLPGNETPLIHTRNLNDIFVRIRTAITVSAVLGAVTGVALAGGGAGYVVGDVLTIAGGGGGATVRVLTVAAGVITAIQLITGGVGYAVAAGVALNGGTGAGATVNITSVLDQLTSVTFPFMVYRRDPGPGPARR